MKNVFKRILLKKKQLLIIALFVCLLLSSTAIFIQNIETYSPINAHVVVTKNVLSEGETSVSMLSVSNNYPVRTIYPMKFMMEDRVTRSDLYNAFIVDRIDITQTLNGTVIMDFPNMIPDSQWTLGRWATNINGSWEDPYTVRKCTILPGENTAVVFSIDVNFDQDQQNQYGVGLYGSTGFYVYTFTIHGTINGMPLDLTVKSAPIYMK